MKRARFSELVGSRFPLQLAGMGGPISDVALTAAVTNAGGVGMLGAGGIPATPLLSMLDALSKVAHGPYGVNFLVPFLDPESVKVASRHCRICDFFFGVPDTSWVQLVHEGGALAGWQVGSVEEAIQACEAGCDFIIVQGMEAGGHIRGRMPLDEFLAKAVASVEIPILASGGIGTPERVRELMDAGAAGVRIGTRFVAAIESAAHPEYVDALIAASAADTVITETFSSDWPDAPHRVLRACIEAAKASDEEVVANLAFGEESLPVQRFSSLPPVSGARGNIAAMAHYAGTSVAQVHGRQPAADIVTELCRLI